MHSSPKTFYYKEKNRHKYGWKFHQGERLGKDRLCKISTKPIVQFRPAAPIPTGANARQAIKTFVIRIQLPPFFLSFFANHNFPTLCTTTSRSPIRCNNRMFSILQNPILLWQRKKFSREIEMNALKKYFIPLPKCRSRHKQEKVKATPKESRIVGVPLSCDSGWLLWHWCVFSEKAKSGGAKNTACIHAFLMAGFVFVCWHSRKWWPAIRGGTLQIEIQMQISWVGRSTLFWELAATD